MSWTTTARPNQRGLFQPVGASTADLTPFLHRYYAGLSRRPYVWSPETRQIFIRGKDYALDFSNLAHGLPNSSQWIVIDVDRVLEHNEFGREDLPLPHVVAQNPVNGHAHLFYHLAYPSRLDNRWFQSLRRQLDFAWQADPLFSGKIAKNLLRSDIWEIYTRNVRSWTFGGLAERLVDFPLPRWQLALWQEVSDQPGRNCEVFEAVRHLAYKERRKGADYDALRASCEAWCEEQNTYRAPLGYAECRHIAKSIAKWTVAHLVPGPAWHAAQGRKSGDSRRQKTADLADQAIDLHRQGLSSRKIARTLGISRGAALWWLDQAEAFPNAGAALLQVQAGGRASGEKRRQKSASLAAQAQDLHRHGLGTPSIARALGVSRGAVVWWLRQARHGGVIGKVDRELNQDQPRWGPK